VKLKADVSQTAVLKVAAESSAEISI